MTGDLSEGKVHNPKHVKMLDIAGMVVAARYKNILHVVTLFPSRVTSKHHCEGE